MKATARSRALCGDPAAAAPGSGALLSGCRCLLRCWCCCTANSAALPHACDRRPLSQNQAASALGRGPPALECARSEGARRGRAIAAIRRCRRSISSCLEISARAWAHIPAWRRRVRRSGATARHRPLEGDTPALRSGRDRRRRPRAHAAPVCAPAQLGAFPPGFRSGRGRHLRADVASAAASAGSAALGRPVWAEAETGFGAVRRSALRRVKLCTPAQLVSDYVMSGVPRLQLRATHVICYRRARHQAWGVSWGLDAWKYRHQDEAKARRAKAKAATCRDRDTLQSIMY